MYGASSITSIPQVDTLQVPIYQWKLQTMFSVYCFSSKSFYLYDLRHLSQHSHVPRYQGFLSAQVAQSQTPNAAGQKVKMAQVIYDSPDLASVAKEALDGFTLKKDWNMSVTYI